MGPSGVASLSVDLPLFTFGMGSSRPLVEV
jgi:hypothetical protein